jgi:Fasciclin domain
VSNAGAKDLKQLLSYHLVTGVIPSSNLRASSTTTAASVQGGDLTIVKSPDGKVVTVNGIAKVETPDVVSRASGNLSSSKTPTQDKTRVFLVLWQTCWKSQWLDKGANIYANKDSESSSISHHHLFCFYSMLCLFF